MRPLLTDLASPFAASSIVLRMSFRLDPTDLQAISTILLVGVTAVYVVLTWRLTKSAAESAAATQAGLDIKFDAEVLFLEGLAPIVYLRCDGAPVWVHAVTLANLLTAAKYEDDLDIRFQPIEGKRSLPRFHHPNEITGWRWRGRRVREEDNPTPFIRVKYSFHKRGEKREVGAVPRVRFRLEGGA